MSAPATTLEVRGNTLPVLAVKNVSDNGFRKFRIKVLGHARSSRVELVHLFLGAEKIRCVVASCLALDIDGTSTLTLYEWSKPVLVQRTSECLRYAKVGIGRFVVCEGRGKALGHILRSAKGHMIEGHPVIYGSMKKALAMFRNGSPATFNGLIENILRRKQRC